MPTEDSIKPAKDRWDKLEILAKSSLAIIIPAAIAWYGISSEHQRTVEAELNRSAQVLIQTLGTRETVGGDLKAKMFGTLMEHYFKGEAESKIAIVELIALNLKDQFQLRPLFERLNAELTSDVDKRELRRVVRNIASKEVRRIVGQDGEACDVELQIGKPTTISCGSWRDVLAFTLVDVKDDRILVHRAPQGHYEDGDTIEVTDFDVPSADNTTFHEMTYALVLSDRDAHSNWARVKVVIFPQHFYSTDNRLQLDQLMGKFLEQRLHSPIR